MRSSAASTTAAKGFADHDPKEAPTAVVTGSGSFPATTSARSVRDPAVATAAAAESRAAARRAELAAVLGDASDLDVLEDGQAVEQLDDLEAAGEAARDARMGGDVRDVVPGEDDAAGVRRQMAGQQVDQRRLAGPVRADDAGDAALLEPAERRFARRQCRFIDADDLPQLRLDQHPWLVNGSSPLRHLIVDSLRDATRSRNGCRTGFNCK